VALSDRRLVVVLGNMQRGNVYLDPPAERDIPISHERIEAISFERIPGPDRPKIKRVRSRGRWELAESWTPEKWSQVVLGGAGGYDKGGAVPTEFVFPALMSGRLVRATFPSAALDDHVQTIIARERGYWLMHNHRRIEIGKPAIGYSDDQGRTWLEGKVNDPCPLTHLYWPFGQLIETVDGALVLPFYGYRTEQDMLDHCYSCAVARSHDGGTTWGHWTILGCDPNRIWSFCEPSMLARPDGVWVAFMRTETPANQPWMSAMMFRTVSLDKGRTWSEPKPSVVGSQPAALLLPDGELAFVVRSTGRQASSVYFSRDLGETWDYALEGAYNTSMAGLLDDDTFWVWANNEALIYRRVRRRTRR